MILAEYAASLGQDAPITGNRLSMTVDDVYQLQLLQRADGRVLVRSRLRSLPEPGPARDDVLRLYGLLACGRMLRSSVTCAVDANERGLWLQQLCKAGSPQALDEHIGSFVNELAFWTSAAKTH
ncbi:CesT family type III secretion system chaperone [Ottowia thiooxydans]|uniref:Type III secretion chaperone SycN n=1 Tax=Ottowia thiooxydans TaxID=219182 RepID=A0ABV2QGF0_9BURK